jgi:hypothetical protein
MSGHFTSLHRGNLESSLYFPPIPGKTEEKKKKKKKKKKESSHPRPAQRLRV